tara:strand:+ start:319 stop:999 length:681 start_codon:yes stop_codon:yes gene_type:complete
MIIVTGGTSGIGYEITRALRAEGENVITLSRRESAEDKNHISCDLTDYNSLKKAYKIISSMKENVYALINCAGIASMNLALTTPPEVTKKIINTNLIGTIFSNQIFSPLIIKANKGGRIINFSTIAVSIGLKGESIYCASKAGVETFSRVFANELSAFEITVNCIAPGPIRTNLLKGVTDKQIKTIVERQIIKKEMKTENVVEIIRLILNKNSTTLTGQVIHIGGF